jgi:hypothetical protein
MPGGEKYPQLRRELDDHLHAAILVALMRSRNGTAEVCPEACVKQVRVDLCKQ